MVCLCLLTAPASARKRGKARGKIAAVPALTAGGLPNVMSAAAVVVDLDKGEEIYAKNADDRRHIASVGKLFVALVVREKKVPLTEKTTISEEDKKYARGGAKSRLLVGKTFTNHDLLRAMLVASDNRAVTALGRAAGLDPEQLVAAVNAKTAELGLTRTEFTDPTGLNGNLSTPREVLVALREALDDSTLAEILALTTLSVTSVDEKPIRVDYVSTNHSLRTGRYPVIGGKTGYTDEARYCFAVAATLGGRKVGMVFLGAEGELTRFADFNRVAGWIEGGGVAETETAAMAGAKPAEGGVGASVESPPAAITPAIVTPPR
jgi:D-alanyl-D-alanine endopeptidase (penicillin-binding protein 7)